MKIEKYDLWCSDMTPSDNGEYVKSYYYEELERDLDDCIRVIAQVRANLPDVPYNEILDPLNSSFAYNIKLYVKELEEKIIKYENS